MEIEKITDLSGATVQLVRAIGYDGKVGTFAYFAEHNELNHFLTAARKHLLLTLHNQHATEFDSLVETLERSREAVLADLQILEHVGLIKKDKNQLFMAVTRQEQTFLENSKNKAMLFPDYKDEFDHYRNEFFKRSVLCKDKQTGLTITFSLKDLVLFGTSLPSVKGKEELIIDARSANKVSYFSGYNEPPAKTSLEYKINLSDVSTISTLEAHFDVIRDAYIKYQANDKKRIVLKYYLRDTSGRIIYPFEKWWIILQVFDAHKRGLSNLAIGKHLQQNGVCGCDSQRALLRRVSTYLKEADRLIKSVENMTFPD